MRKSNWTVWLSIISAVLLVLLPIAFDRIPGIAGRWKFAQAANAVDLETGEAQELLDAAAKHFDRPQDEPDYWNVKLKLSFKQGRNEVIKVLHEAISHNLDFRFLTLVAYMHFDKEMDFEGALQSIVMYYATGNKIDAEALNQIAYLRSLAKADLNTALKEINQALERKPGEWPYLDTRAWILFQMGSPKSAIEDADLAVKLSEDALVQEENSFWEKLNRWSNGTASPAKGNDTITAQEAGPLLWSAAVVRYHRGKIREALGDSTGAEQDLQWLRDRRIPIDDRLH